jgi:fatty acid desaturase
MANQEFKHLKKEQLKKRIKILKVLIYLFAAIGIGSFTVFFFTHYRLNWSWLLIGLTYILLSVNYSGQLRRMHREIQRREERLSQEH